MVSPELIRRYGFFSGLSMEHIVELAKVAEEVDVEACTFFFHEDEEIHHLYLLLSGEVGLVMNIPQKEIVSHVIVAGDVFGWSALVPPYLASVGAKSLTDCQVVRIDCREIRPKFEEDSQFGYRMMEKIAQLIRQRLRDLRIESLAYNAD